MRLDQIIAIVTGGASGMGEATTRAIINGGGKVCIACLPTEKAEAMARELGEDKCLYVETDVSDEEQARNAVETAVKKFGSINALINCAGIGPAMKILPKEGGVHTTEMFDNVININLKGGFNMICYAALAMKDNEPVNDDGERGCIVNTVSIAVECGQIGQAAYAASKGGLQAMTLPIARELGRYGIRCNCVAPGVVQTPLLGVLSDRTLDGLKHSEVFPKRLGKPEEFASIVCEILRNCLINGTTVHLDGAIRM